MTPSGVASEAAGDGKAEHRRLLRSDGPHRSSSFCQPGDVVITDNLSPHENAETRCLIQQRGADVLFLPPYSLDLNPIEKMWSNSKNFYAPPKAAPQPSVIQAIASALEAITPRGAIN